MFGYLFNFFILLYLFILFYFIYLSYFNNHSFQSTFYSLWGIYSHCWRANLIISLTWDQLINEIILSVKFIGARIKGIMPETY